MASYLFAFTQKRISNKYDWGFGEARGSLASGMKRETKNPVIQTDDTVVQSLKKINTKIHDIQNKNIFHNDRI